MYSLGLKSGLRADHMEQLGDQNIPFGRVLLKSQYKLRPTDFFLSIASLCHQ